MEFFIILLFLAHLAIWLFVCDWVKEKIGKTYAFWFTFFFGIFGAIFAALISIAENTKK